MYLSRKVTLLMIYSALCFNLFIRYPYSSFSESSSSEIGMNYGDGLYFRWHSQILLENGFNPLIWNFLSYFGMYPFSYPFGPQTAVASLSLVTGLDLSTSILPYDWFLGFIALLSMFILSMEIKRDRCFAFFSAFLYSTNWYFVNETIWSLTLRCHLVAFLPIFVLALVKVLRIKENSFGRSWPFSNQIFLVIGSYFILLTSHRMIIFVLPTIVFPIVLYKLIWASNTANRQTLIKNAHSIFVFGSLLTLTVFLLTVFNNELINDLGIPSNAPTSDELEKYPFFGFLTPLANVIALYLIKSILQFFAIFTLFYFFVKPRIDSSIGLFFICILVFQSRFYIDVDYFMPIASLIISFLGSFGIKVVLGNIYNRKSAYAILLVLLLLSSSALYTYHIKKLNTSSGSLPEFIEVGEGVPPEAINSGFWVDYHVSEDSMLMISDPQSLFSIQLSETRPTLLAYNLIIMDGATRERLIFEPYSWVNIFFHQRELTFGGRMVDPVFINMGVNPFIHPRFYQLLVAYDHPSSDLIIDYYEIKYAVDGNWFGNGYSDTPFYSNLNENSYIIYENEIIKFWFYKNNY